MVVYLGLGMGWYLGCFICVICNEFLVDMIYFCRNEEIYCERYYVDIIYFCCVVCDEVLSRLYRSEFELNF